MIDLDGAADAADLVNEKAAAVREVVVLAPGGDPLAEFLGWLDRVR
jgi:hypothetical protein